MFIFAVLVVVKLVNIQFIHGKQYRDLAEERTIQNVVIPANRGNVYSADGSLLATSVPKYDIRFDAIAPSAKNFEKHIKPLSDSWQNFMERLRIIMRKSYEKPERIKTDTFW